MDIRQLRYFLAIARENQITRAAKTLNMEQPPLSRQLKLIEDELGIKLFERNGKRLKLTQAGEVLQTKAKSLLHQLDDTITEIREISQGLSGTVAIGSVFSCVSLLPAPIKHVREQYPGLVFRILEGDHFTLGEHLENREIELVITRLPFESGYPADHYAVYPLPSDPFVLVTPQAWCPSITTIHMKDIAAFPLLALKSDKTVRLHEKIVHECRRFGFEPKFVSECSSVAIIVALVAAGIGATILPKSVMTSFPVPDIKMLSILDTSFQSDVGIIWLSDRQMSKSAQAFLSGFVRDEAPV